MNYKSLILLVISLSIIGCKNKDTQLYPTFKRLTINPVIKDFIVTLEKENKCSNCIVELYIDVAEKNSNINYTLKIRPYSSEYLKRNNPLFYLKENGLYVYVYSGMEEALTGDEKCFPKEKESRDTVFTVWNIKYFNGKYTVNKRGIPAFVKIPLKTNSIKIP